MKHYTVITEVRLEVGVVSHDSHDLDIDEAKEIARPIAEQHGHGAGLTWSYDDYDRRAYNSVTVYYLGDWHSQEVEA